jgi:hypothetical protein
LDIWNSLDGISNSDAVNGKSPKFSPKKKDSVALLLVCLFLSSLMLTGCGGQSSPIASIPITSISSTSGIILTTNQAFTPTLNPTNTVVLTPTPASTPTAIPTPTVPPTSTPVPLPTSLLLGQQGNEWGQITAYYPSPTDLLEVLSLQSDLEEGLGNWFQYAPMLSKTPATTNSNQYLLKIEPQLLKDVLNGLPVANFIGSEVRAGYAAGSTPVRLPLSQASKLLRPDPIFGVIEWISSQIFQPEITKQLDDISNKVDEIKGFLEAKEQASIQGNLKYLNDLAGNLQQFKPDSEDLKIYLAQLEPIERESLQSMSLLEGQLNSTSDTVKTLSFDKSFVLFRNEDKVKQLNKAVTDFKNQASSYETVLLVRGLAGEIRCALPYSRDVALARLADVRNELTDWRGRYQQFFQLVDQKIPQMDGLFADNKTQENLKETSRLGKLDAENEYIRADAFFAGTIQKVNKQVQEASLPLLIIAELDGQGKLKQVSKLIQ